MPKKITLTACTQTERCWNNPSKEFIFNYDSINSYLCSRGMVQDTYPQHKKKRLERVQRIALKYILPDITYDDARAKLKLPSIESFINNLSIKLLKNIANSGGHHRLYKRLPKKCVERRNRVTRNSDKFGIEQCRTEKRTNSYFPHTV